MSDDTRKAVAEAYYSTVARDGNDHLAFAIALGVYFNHCPGVSDDTARDAVTIIIAEARQGSERRRWRR